MKREEACHRPLVPAADLNELYIASANELQMQAVRCQPGISYVVRVGYR